MQERRINKMGDMTTFSWKKTSKKFGWSLALVLISGAVVVATDNKMWLILVPVLEAARNIIKHKFELAWF